MLEREPLVGVALRFGVFHANVDDRVPAEVLRELTQAPEIYRARLVRL